MNRSRPRTRPITRVVPSTGELTVNKLSFAALSLIGAIPGGYLTFRLVMALVHHFRDMVGMMKVVVGLILLLSAVVTVIPIGILIFVREEKEKKLKDEPTEADADDVSETPATEAADGESAVLDQSTNVDATGDFDDFAEPDEEPEPEPKGKKKKKKKK
jgi:hypothetical protein